MVMFIVKRSTEGGSAQLRGGGWEAIKEESRLLHPTQTFIIVFSYRPVSDDCGSSCFRRKKKHWKKLSAGKLENKPLLFPF